MEKLKEQVTAGLQHFKKNPEYLERNPEQGMLYVTEIVFPALDEVLKNLLYKIENRHRFEEHESRKKVSVIHYTSLDTLISMLQNASVERRIESLRKLFEEYYDEPVHRNALMERRTAKLGFYDELNSLLMNLVDSVEGRSASLRLYDSVHFNDPDEGIYFNRNLNLVKGHKLLKARNAPHAYIVSFIRPDAERAEMNPVSDDLVFWRTYGKDGEGCSLTLSVPSCRLLKVLYGTDKVKCTDLLLKSVLDLLYDSLSPLISIPEQPIDVQEKLAGIVVRLLEKIQYLFKDKAYQYENECRFVIPESETDRNKICFEYGGQCNTPTRIRHYYEDKDLEIEEILGSGSLITLGPCVPYPENVRYYLETLLQKAELRNTEIKISKIRYRKS